MRASGWEKGGPPLPRFRRPGAPRSPAGGRRREGGFQPQPRLQRASSSPPAAHPFARAGPSALRLGHSPARESAPASGCLCGLPFMSRSRRVMLSPRGAGRSAPPHPFPSPEPGEARRNPAAAGRLRRARPIGTFPLFSLGGGRQAGDEVAVTEAASGAAFTQPAGSGSATASCGFCFCTSG